MNKNLTATVLIVIAVGIYFTITQSMVADAQSVKAKNDQLTSALDNADEIIRSREDVIKKYNSISAENREKLDKMIPSAVDNIRLVIDLNNLALRNHFSLSDVRATVGSSAQGRGQTQAAPAPAMGAPVAPGGTATISEPVLDKVQVTFNATASYQQFMDFMKDIESSLRIMDLSHLAVTVSDEGADKYDFQVQFQTYWLRQ